MRTPVMEHRNRDAPALGWRCAIDVRTRQRVEPALYPLAYLGLARAAASSADPDASRLAYEALFGIWKDADPDLAILRVARREYRQQGVARDAGGQSPKSP
jgi:hypothetical protein